MKEGIYTDLSNNAYHEGEGLSSSELKPALVSTKLYNYYQKNKKKSSEAMDEGTLFHTCVLEPEKFTKSYLLKPEISKRSKEGKEAHRMHEEECYTTGCISATSEVIDTVNGMANAVNLHPEIGAILLSKGKSEVSCYAKDPETGILLKARADWLFEVDGETYIFDLKKARHADILGFKRAVQDYHYDLSAFHYIYVFGLAGIDVKGFFWGACESTEPYSCALYQADETRMQVGESKFRLAMKRIVDLKNQKRQRDINNGKPLFVPAADWEVEKWCNNPEILTN